MDPRTIAENVRTVFSLPDIALRINELIGSEKTSNAELERIILHDPAITAKILRFANSAYFGFSREIETISRAITLIGHKELRNLVLATSVISTFEDISSDLIDMESFWYQSVTCGVVAKVLADYKKNKARERFFIAGLLHAIGKLILLSQFPKESAVVLRSNNQGNYATTNAELEMFGFTHAQLGAELFKLWKLPPSIWKMIEFQLNPLDGGEFCDDACILHVASNFASCIQPFASNDNHTDEIKPAYQPEVWNHLDLDDDVHQTVHKASNSQVFDILSTIRPQTVIIC